MMKILRNTTPISDLVTWLTDGELTINRDYQRSAGLWPQPARSYFIDTLLNDFPFPKIVIRQKVDLKTRKTKREVIDGQQRLTTILDFIENKFRLSNVSRLYHGSQFSELPEDVQYRFLSYEVSTDTVVSATESEVLEIFRRINSYTLPLKAAEKRHASYQGEFKWFIRDLLEQYSPMLGEYNILSLREISRMADAELLSELCQIIMEGLKTRQSYSLEKIYKENDSSFSNYMEVKQKVIETLDFIKIELNPILRNEILRGYSFYSLFSALVYNRYGIINLQSEELDGLEKIGCYTTDINKSIQGILELFSAVDEKDVKGKYSEFVNASQRATTSFPSRKSRLKWLAKALQGKMK